MQNSPARSSIDVGSVIAGTYTIEALVGRGGMGAVFLASHNRLPGKKVAIKVLHAELDGEEINARFKREAQIASLLSHPNIVHIEDYNVTAEGMPYLVLEYLQGESLAQRLRHGPMTVDQTVPVIRQIGSALAAAHSKGIVHRDLKPQNIFLMPSEIDGRKMEIAKVLDFGISKMRDSQTLKTQDNALLGTPQYMAPEQATGQHDKVDERTDIFALGAIVYEMLSGQPAFSGQTIPEVVFKVVYEHPIPLATRVPSLSDQVTSAVQRALSKPADERFPSVTAFLEALTGSPVSLIRNPSSPPPPVDGTSATSASGRTPNTGGDAFAQTMGSGDHGASPLATASAPVTPLTRTPPPDAPIAAGDAITLASQDGRVEAPTREVASTVASTERPTEPVPSGSRRTLLVAGGVLTAAVAAAGIMYAVMRKDPAPAPIAAADPPVASEVAPANTSDVPPFEKDLLAAPAQPDGSGTGSGSAIAAKPDAAKPDAGKPKPKETSQRVGDSALDMDGTPTTEDDDSRAGKKLREAFAELRQQHWEKAGAAATLVATSEDARPEQLARARMILGIAACHRNDEEGARAALRTLHKQTLKRAKVLAACHKLKYLLETKR